jgi:diacylglycerol kinase (ATP)
MSASTVAATHAGSNARDAAEATGPSGTGRILVVWNPNAGSKAGVPTNLTGRDDLLRIMATHSLGRELFESPSTDATNAKVDEAVAAGVDVIVAAGGDGTARSIALRLLDHQTALGLLPLGSAMNLGRSLGIPRDLEEAAAVIAAGHVRKIDVGEIDGRPFIEQVSVGLSAEALGDAHAIDKRRFGAAISLLGLMLQRKQTHIELDIDGEIQRSRALAIAIANTPYTGLGLELAPGASVDDGLLNVVVFEGTSPLGLARYMAATIGGRPAPERFRTHRAKRIRVSSRRRLPVRFDADDGGTTPIEVSVRPGALRVMAPASPKPR